MAGRNTSVKTSPVQAVIFDMDGVIVDSEPLGQRHLEQFLTELGADNPRISHIYSSLKGKNSRDTWTILRDEFGLNHDIDLLVSDCQQSFLEYMSSLEKLPEIPGAVRFIKQLRTRGYPLALASSSHVRRVELFLTTLGIERSFSAIVTGDDIKKSKPDPEVFLLAAARLDVKPNQCVVIEDAHNGVRAAKAAGMKCIAYAGSDHNTDDLSRADLVIKDFAVLSRNLRKGLPLV